MKKDKSHMNRFCEFCSQKIDHLFMSKGGFFSCHLCFRKRKDEELRLRSERDRQMAEKRGCDPAQLRTRIKELAENKPITPPEKRWDGYSQ